MNHRRVRGSYAIDLSSQWNGFTQAAQALFTSLIKPFPSTCLNKILPNSLFGQRSQLMPLVLYSICTSHLGCFVFLCTVPWNNSWWTTVSRMIPPPSLSLKLRDGKTPPESLGLMSHLQHHVFSQCYLHLMQDQAAVGGYPPTYICPRSHKYRPF